MRRSTASFAALATTVLGLSIFTAQAGAAQSSVTALCAKINGTYVGFLGVNTSEWLAKSRTVNGVTQDLTGSVLAAFGPTGLFCPDSFNTVGLKDSGTLVDGTGKTNYTNPINGGVPPNLYDLWVKTS